MKKNFQVIKDAKDLELELIFQKYLLLDVVHSFFEWRQ